MMLDGILAKNTNSHSALNATLHRLPGLDTFAPLLKRSSAVLRPLWASATIESSLLS